MPGRIDRLATVTLWLCLLPALAGAVDVDAALEAAKKPKKDENKAEVAGSAQAAQEDMQRRIDALEEERRRKRQQLIDRVIGPPGSSASPSGSPAAAGHAYLIHKDRGREPAWVWYERELVLQCVGGRNNGQYPSIYLLRNGRWKAASTFDSRDEAARQACGGL